MNHDSPAKARVSPILLGHLAESEMLNHWARVTARLDFTVSWRNKTATNCFAWHRCWSFFFLFPQISFKNVKAKSICLLEKLIKRE